MKLVHLSDLHIGIKINEYSMIEDQEYILKKILGIIDDEKPNAVVIAGDIYDKSVPSGESVSLFDDFLVALAKRKLDVFVISGNHDSPERISFGARIMDESGIHLSPVYSGEIKPICIEDDYGEVYVYMLPFIKPTNVRQFFGEDEINSYTDAVGCAIKHMNVDTSKRNILVTHQFVTGSTRTESENISVGGAENVDVNVFEPFDYVALGHLHSPQSCGSNKIRYCGTPLKYSFSEAKDQKSVTVVELKEKGYMSLRTIDLVPYHDMAEIRGKYNDIVLKSFYENTSFQEDYVHITLTDEQDIPDAIGKLRSVYHRLMKLDYDNKRTRSNSQIIGDEAVEQKTPFELFSEFYELQNNQSMNDEQSAFMKDLIEKTWEDEQ